MNDHNESDDPDTSYYDVLGISQSASDDEIAAAYREQAKEYHPDRSDHPDATDLFADINQARDALLEGAERTEWPENQQRLNYVWRDGSPVRPTEDARDSSQPGDEDEGDTGDESHSSEDDGEQGDDDEEQRNDDEQQSDDDSPWVTDSDDDGGHTDPDPDPEDVVIGGGVTDEPAASQRGLTRREIVAMLGLGGVGVLSANYLGWFGSSDDGSSDKSEEFLTVGPDDSLQDAIGRMASGGTLELEPGTYFEAITIDRSLTLDAPSGATLDGRETDGEAAIRIEAPEVTVSGVDIVEYDGPGVWTPTVESEISLADLSLSELSGHGILVGGDAVTVRSTTVQDCGNTGIRTESTADGTVEVADVVIERSEREVSFGDVEAEGRGITVVGGSDVTITGAEALDNGGNNIRIDGGEARGQTIEIRNSTALGSGSGSNILVKGTGRGDDVVVDGIVAEEGDQHGINIGWENRVESVDIADVEASDNGDTGVRIESTGEGTVEVTNVLVEWSEREVSFGDVEAEGRGVTVVGGSDISVTEAEALDNGGNNIRIDGGEARGQSVEIRDSTALGSGSGSNILVEGTGRGDDVVVDGIVAEEGDQHGINIGWEDRVESVDIADVEASDNGDTGIRTESTADGTVEIADVVVERSEREVSFGDVEAEGRGVAVVGGSDVTVTGTEALDNGGNNIRIDGGETRGQSVEIRDSTASNSTNGSGIFTGGTDGQDDTEIHDVEANGNAEYGLDLGGETITITGTTAEDNEEGPYNFRDTDREDVTLQNSTDA